MSYILTNRPFYFYNSQIKWATKSQSTNEKNSITTHSLELKNQDENEEEKKDFFCANVIVEKKIEWNWIIWKVENKCNVWVVQEQNTECLRRHFIENEKKCATDVFKKQMIHTKTIDEDESLLNEKRSLNSSLICMKVIWYTLKNIEGNKQHSTELIVIEIIAKIIADEQHTVNKMRIEKIENKNFIF